MSTMRARYHELVAQQENKNRQFVALRDAQSKALINGTTFTDGEKLRPLEDEIHALDAAITTAHEQARVEERREQAANEAVLLRRESDHVANLCDQYHVELANAQTALEEATRALLKINKLSENVNRIIGPYSGTAIASVGEFNSQNIGYRMSERIVLTLSQLGVNGYGSLLWSPRPANSPDRNWADEDRALIDGALKYPLGQMSKKAEELEAEANAE